MAKDGRRRSTPNAASGTPPKSLRRWHLRPPGQPGTPSIG